MSCSSGGDHLVDLGLVGLGRVERLDLFELLLEVGRDDVRDEGLLVGPRRRLLGRSELLLGGGGQLLVTLAADLIALGDELLLGQRRA